MPYSGVKRVVSGGQTGADRGGLEAAIRAGIEIGGWMPRHGRAEDGVVPEKYGLRECGSTDYRVRTRLNIRDSDGTLIFIGEKPAGGGSLFTAREAIAAGKPHLIIPMKEDPYPAPTIRLWLRVYQIEILNVAGNRESKAPGIQESVTEILHAALTHGFANLLLDHWSSSQPT